MIHEEISLSKARVKVSGSLNLGLISGDLKRSTSPFIIKKTHHSPITINIRPGIFRPKKLFPPILPPILSLKTLPIKTKIKKALKSPIKPPKLLKIPTLPKLPKLPIVPLIPPLLLPKLPKLPLLPLPILPLTPPLPPSIMPLKKLIKPIRIPILGKTKLQKALSSELKPLKVISPKTKIKKKILENLRKLKKDGSLTTSQFLQFKKKFEL
ncbi:unnamed protein product [Euphydryas editha]|uniref:SHOCT domain-containing protein n=1 Tax=Euphydryas editha TaxID=104508 RepID=A0AAU9U750_EUPED|nr:unnamed protein product [Euphydryas editha]